MVSAVVVFIFVSYKLLFLTDYRNGSLQLFVALFSDSLDGSQNRNGRLDADAVMR